MIQKSLVYIYATHPRRTFVGCGAFVEGGYGATCRHVWTTATVKDGDTEKQVEIVFPYHCDPAASVIVGSLLSDCDLGRGPAPDLLLLSLSAVPPDIVALQAAADTGRETGEAQALAGLVDPGRPGGPFQVEIMGKLAEMIGADGLRQFTGANSAGYWPNRGSSGSPVFLTRGQQLAGILSLATFQANAGRPISGKPTWCPVRSSGSISSRSRPFRSRGRSIFRLPICRTFSKDLELRIWRSPTFRGCCGSTSRRPRPMAESRRPRRTMSTSLPPSSGREAWFRISSRAKP